MSLARAQWYVSCADRLAENHAFQRTFDDIVGSLVCGVTGQALAGKGIAMRTLRYLGDLLASGVFIFGGLQAFLQPAPRAAKAEALGLPEASLGVQVNALVMIAGGVALGLGMFPRAAAALLATSLVPTTIVGHPFWREGTPAARQAQTTQFLKNLAMLAALLFIITGARERG